MSRSTFSSRLRLLPQAKGMAVVVAAVAAAMVMGTAGAFAQTIPPGTDCFETTNDSSWVVFGGGGGGGAMPPIPAGFFGPGSDPFEGTVALRGEPLAAYPGEVSTLVERLGPATMPGPTTVEVEMVELSLVSVQPITVTYDMMPDSFFDVFVTLSDNTDSTGYMRIQETTLGVGGWYDFNTASGGGIYVYPKFVFTRTEPPYDVFTLQDPAYPGYQVVLENNETVDKPTWQYATPVVHCFPDNFFYPVPGEEVNALLNGGDAGGHGVIPPRVWTGCCFPGGACVDMYSEDCVAQGGTPQGSLCYGYTDACCFPDGSCLMIDPLCCDDEGGTTIAGAMCGGVEACCDNFVPNGCMDADSTCCTRYLGGWLPGQPACLGDPNSNGVDEACEGPQPEACCLPNGDCLNMLPDNCVNSNGWPQGPGTACAGQTVACCDPNIAMLCITTDLMCCDDFAGWEGYASTCLGDGDSNGIDDACEQEDLEPKWIQFPHEPQEGFDVASDLWWTEGPPAKWRQNPEFTITGHHCHDGPTAGDQLICANDWQCGGGRVTDFHWWGYQEPAGPGEQQWGFQISIHTNGLNCLPADPALRLWTVPLSQIVITDTGYISMAGTPIYHYSWDLPVPFDQVDGRYYWMDLSSISMDAANPYVWKWVQSVPAPILCPAAYKQLPNPGLWTSFDDVELAFVVTSDDAQLDVNKVVADDFFSDGRPIRAVRWWGSYLDPQYSPEYDPIEPWVLDGWFISFHHGDPAIANPGCPPDWDAGDDPTVLGLYYAPVWAVEIINLGFPDCLNHTVYEYRVDLSQCCLLCAEFDPRTGTTPADIDGFNEEAELHYWLDIQAVVGVTWDPPACDYDSRILTGHEPSDVTTDGHFWGWHTSPAHDMRNGPLWGACTGRIMNPGPYTPNDCWDYHAWDVPLWECPEPPPPPDQIDMAFELLAPVWPVIRSVASCHYHCTPHPACDAPANEHCLDIGLGSQAYNNLGPLNDYNVEPRMGFAKKLELDMSQDMAPLTVIGGNVQVSCYLNAYAGVISASLSGTSTVVVQFAPGLPDQDCCRIGLVGMTSTTGDPVTDAYFVCVLEGDADRDNFVTTADDSAITQRLGQTTTDANQQYDVDIDGFISTADGSFVIQRLGRLAPKCP